MTTRRDFLKSALALSAMPGHAAPAPRLNFVFVLIDDLGWTDFSCYGSRFYETPNIDRLASEGMRFTQAYSACTVCSPSRAAILTGRYPARLHITDWIAGANRPYAKLRPPDWTQHLPLEETTIAEALKPAGYATASIGKWHLGNPEFYPEKQGFDLNIAGTHMGQPPSYFSPYGIPTIQDGPPGEYLTDRLFSEAKGFLERNRERPFFLYLPNFAVHTPLQAKKEIIAKYAAKVRAGMAQNNATYAAMIESVDQGVGRLVQNLHDLRLDDRTVVILTSDNGGLLRSTSNIPLREGKGSAYEGGVRVPFIVRWPGVTKPDTVCDVPVMGIDYFPTILEIAGMKSAAKPDGVSIASLLHGGGRLRRDTLYWHYPHYHQGGATPYSAIRAGDFRLVEFQEDGHIEMYNLNDDIGEQHDLVRSMPAKARALQTSLAAWRRAVGAQMALSNPAYDPARETQFGRASGPGDD
jgi:arylsulfatase A-like enzyme